MLISMIESSEHQQRKHPIEMEKDVVLVGGINGIAIKCAVATCLSSRFASHLQFSESTTILCLASL